jgi:hypothetical protein
VLKTAVPTSFSSFDKYFGHVTTYNFVQINIITLNYVYYKIFHLKHRYEHSVTLILHKTYARFIRN